MSAGEGGGGGGGGGGGDGRRGRRAAGARALHSVTCVAPCCCACWRIAHDSTWAFIRRSTCLVSPHDCGAADDEPEPPLALPNFWGQLPSRQWKAWTRA